MRQNGVGFLGLLGLLFIGLKLGGVIAWSWWLVLLPLYAPILLALALFIPFCIIVLLIGLVQAIVKVQAKK